VSQTGVSLAFNANVAKISRADKLAPKRQQRRRRNIARRWRQNSRSSKSGWRGSSKSAGIGLRFCT